METRRKHSDKELSYLAGLIDADGYIGIVKGTPGAGGTINYRYGLTVVVTNTSEVLMDWLRNNFEGKVYTKTPPKGKNWKVCYSWVMGYRNAEKLLRLIEQYLVVKRQQALYGIELMEFWVTDNRGTPPEEVSRRERLYRLCKELNTPGALGQRERLNPEAPSTEG